MDMETKEITETMEESSIMTDGTPTSEDVAVITKGMRIKGDVESDGSIEIVGDITGNVTCKGKLTISGKVNGNSRASEIFVNQARIEGEIVSDETVKVGNGTVIIGNISASSAVVAGAVKGDIDVNGPVVVDASAVVMGNIKSRSVQINSGAVIEGTISQCYSEVNVQGIFDEK
ncbi:MAG: polymer-forming cytoskeletal protein [Lachnospiraceae bacterium]|nr:polymer-forming cytoskeletal protein [Lachnospiraceae bacterium]